MAQRHRHDFVDDARRTRRGDERPSRTLLCRSDATLRLCATVVRQIDSPVQSGAARYGVGVGLGRGANTSGQSAAANG